MANVGQQLSNPESGYQRISYRSAAFTYTDSFYDQASNATPYRMYDGGTVGASIKFKFKGTKFYIIGDIDPSYGDNNNDVLLTIDGSESYISFDSVSQVLAAVVHSVTGLANEIHTVEIRTVSGGILFRALDIDSDGVMYTHWGGSVKTSLSGIQRGDVIPCLYDATTGAVGSFSNIGSANGKFIPLAGVNPPSTTGGDMFRFICVENKDGSGATLIADRNIQTTISWNTLHTARLIDGNEEALMRMKMANPSSLPANAGEGCTFSPDGKYLAVAHTSGVYITIYSIQNGIFTKLNDPGTIPGGPGKSVSFSPDSIYMAVAHTSSPYVTIYKIANDVFTKLNNPDVLPVGNGTGVAFSNNGTYLAVTHASAPYISVYKRNGDAFTKLSEPATGTTTSAATSVAFSPDDIYMAVGCASSPNVVIYKRTGDSFAKLSNPGTLPGTNGRGVAFSPDGTYLSVATGGTPCLTVYRRSVDTFTKLTLSADPDSGGFGTCWSPDGRYLLSSNVTNFNTYEGLAIYKRSGDNFIKLANPSELLIDNGYSTAYSPDGKYLVIGRGSSPYINIYKNELGTLIRSMSGGCSATSLTVSPIMTSNSSPAPYVVTTSSTLGGTWDVYKLFSGTTGSQGTEWATNGANTAWVKIDLGSPKIVTDYKLVGSYQGVSYNPKTWTIQGSNNNADWTTLHSIINETWDSLNQVKNYAFQNTTAYRYYKIDITANNGSANYVQLNEWTLYNYSPSNLGAIPGNNEWDTFIRLSTLGNKITAGETNVWNWNQAIRTWCKDTPEIATAASTNRTVRGYSSELALPVFTNASNATTGVAFRPVLEIHEDGTVFY